MSLFDTDQNLFDERRAVTKEHVPDELIGRDAEREALRIALGLDGDRSPSDVFVVGPRGTGKTTLVRTVLDGELSEELPLDATAYVDCEETETYYRTAIRIVNQLRERDLATTGYSTEYVTERLSEALDDRENPLVVLDGLQSLKGTGTVEKFVGDGQFATATLVGVADDESSLAVELSEFAGKTIRCDPYTASELRDIVSARAEHAFTSNALSEEVVPLCAAYAAEAHGDAATAIALLRTAGDVAARELDARISGYHVQEARARRKRERFEERLDGVDVHGHLVLYAILDAARDDQLPARSRDVYAQYRTLAETATHEPLVFRRIRARLETLGDDGFLNVEKHNEGRGGGVYKEYDLAVATDLVAELLSETAELPAVDRTIAPQ